MILDIELYDNYSDCETCGLESNIMVTVSSSDERFKEIESGSYASCFGVELADYVFLVKQVLKQLQELGFDIKEPEWKERPKDLILEEWYKENIIDTGLVAKTYEDFPEDFDWESYWVYDEYKDHPLEDAYYQFYDTWDIDNVSFFKFLEEHGIQINYEFKSDTFNDWEDDDYCEYWEE